MNSVENRLILLGTEVEPETVTVEEREELLSLTDQLTQPE